MHEACEDTEQGNSVSAADQSLGSCLLLLSLENERTISYLLNKNKTIACGIKTQFSLGLL